MMERDAGAVREGRPVLFTSIRQGGAGEVAAVGRRAGPRLVSRARSRRLMSLPLPPRRYPAPVALSHRTPGAGEVAGRRRMRASAAVSTALSGGRTILPLLRSDPPLTLRQTGARTPSIWSPRPRAPSAATTSLSIWTSRREPGSRSARSRARWCCPATASRSR
ncbi:hypothetical protein [Nonomuraea dietziae]|uniref:hypothetical protein n=1 Tax=Nonomuraea dietziae TaxID=65515 RepID=UPI003CD087C6